MKSRYSLIKIQFDEDKLANEPLVVNRVQLAKSDFMMAVPPFIDQHGAEEDKLLARELLKVSRECRVLLGQFFLYTAMTRSKEFAKTCNASDAREGAAIVVGSLMRTMVVTIAALFDEDKRTSNIPKILRAASSPARSEFLRKFHKHYDFETESNKSRRTLVKYGRAIRMRSVEGRNPTDCQCAQYVCCAYRIGASGVGRRRKSDCARF
jgi:hypothetical protein